MAKFNGEVTFKVTFKDLGVPVGFGMTNAIILLFLINVVFQTIQIYFCSYF